SRYSAGPRRPRVSFMPALPARPDNSPPAPSTNVGRAYYYSRSRAAMPAITRYGPKLNDSPAFMRPAMRRSKAIARASDDEVNTIKGSGAQPNHAPSAASNLKSPRPIP